MNQIGPILVADRSPLMRLGVRTLLTQCGDGGAVDEAADMRQVQRWVAEHSAPAENAEGAMPLVLIDSRLPGFHRFQQLQLLPNRQELAVLLLVEGVGEALLGDAQRNGVEGVIDKGVTPEQLLDVVSTLANGGRWYWGNPAAVEKTAVAEPLSRQQSRVFELLRAGLSNKQIAADLSISESTVKHHVSKIYRKSNMPQPNRVLLASAE